MTDRSRPIPRGCRRLTLSAALVLAIGAMEAHAQRDDDDDAPMSGQPMPAEPQPAAADLAPGLAVRYYRNFFRHIDELVDWKKYRDGEAGEPLPMLDYKVGKGAVLTSGTEDGVGAEITGFIRLDKPGLYFFAVESNDGVRITLGGARVLDDPDVHGDRFSDPAQVEIAEPGWYPLHIDYFERKNTSTLKLHWLEPDSDGGTMPLVPAEVFAHGKTTK